MSYEIVNYNAQKHRKRKERRIKHLHKKHIFPIWCKLFFFTVFFAVGSTMSLYGFLSYFIDSKLESTYSAADAMIETAASLPEDELAAFFEKNGVSDSAVLYGEHGSILYNGTHENPRSDDRIFSFTPEDNKNVCLSPESISQYAKNLPRVAGELSEGKFQDPDWIKAASDSIDTWTYVKSEDEKNELWLSEEVSLTNKENTVAALVMGGELLMALIPLLMYLSASVRSVIHQNRLANALYIDTVTFGKNWLYFRQYGDSFLSKRNRLWGRYAVVSLRMKKFRNYSTYYGTDAGEELLEKVSSVINSSLRKRKREISARYSHSEFGILMHMDSPDELNARLTALMNTLSQCGLSKKIEFTAGVYEILEKTGSVDDFFGCAGIARESIPEDSDETIAWFDEKMRSDRMWERKVEEMMQQALDNHEFQVYIQPKYSVNGVLGGAEALIRWVSPTEGFIGPGKFIPIFEKNGFITKIDDFMLSEVASLQKKWIDEGKAVVPISVNISRVHFASPDLAEHICEIVDKSGAPRSCIELELTESAFFDDKENIIRTVMKLQEMGFSVSMDDFGSGYSSLNSLKELPLDVMKLDMDFFRGNLGERGKTVVSDAIKLAKDLNMKVVAEGIESKDQVEFLSEQDCDLIQGYYFAKPLPVAEYEERMEEYRKYQLHGFDKKEPEPEIIPKETEEHKLNLRKELPEE